MTIRMLISDGGTGGAAGGGAAGGARCAAAQHYCTPNLDAITHFLLGLALPSVVLFVALGLVVVMGRLRHGRES